MKMQFAMSHYINLSKTRDLLALAVIWLYAYQQASKFNFITLAFELSNIDTW